MEGKSGEILKKSKITYRRSYLLSLTGLERCKSLPEDFERSVLSEFHDAMDAPGMQRSSTGLTSYYSSHHKYDSLQYIGCDSVWKSHSPSRRWENQPLRLTRECFVSGHTGSDSRKQDNRSLCLMRVSRLTAGIIGPKPQEYDQVYHPLRKSENPYRPPHTCKEANSKSEDDPASVKPNSMINFGVEEDLMVHKNIIPLHVNKRFAVPVTDESSEFVNLSVGKQADDKFVGERKPFCKASKPAQGGEVIDSLAQSISTNVVMGEYSATCHSRTLEDHHNCALDSKSSDLLAIERPFVSNVDNEMVKASSGGSMGNFLLDLGPYSCSKTELNQMLHSNKVLSSAVGSSVDTITITDLLDSDDMPLLGANDGFLTSLLIGSGAYGTNYKDIRTSIFASELEMDKTEENLSILHEWSRISASVQSEQERSLASVADSTDMTDSEITKFMPDKDQESTLTIDKDDSKATICLPDEEDLC